MSLRSATLLAVTVLLSACAAGNTDPLRQAENPDPNHTHADIAVFIEGEPVDLSGDEYMSGSVEEEPNESQDDHEHEHKHDYLHLHDNVGTVVHRHKPGLSIGEFFGSLGFTVDSQCFMDVCTTSDASWRMLVNGEEMPVNMDYVFADLDQILLTYNATDAEVQTQLEQMTDDACLYSRTCPQRGDPPAENCVADPAVPCVVPEGDL